MALRSITSVTPNICWVAAASSRCQRYREIACFSFPPAASKYGRIRA